MNDAQWIEPTSPAPAPPMESRGSEATRFGASTPSHIIGPFLAHSKVAHRKSISLAFLLSLHSPLPSLSFSSLALWHGDVLVLSLITAIKCAQSRLHLRTSPLFRPGPPFHAAQGRDRYPRPAQFSLLFCHQLFFFYSTKTKSDFARSALPAHFRRRLSMAPQSLGGRKPEAGARGWGWRPGLVAGAGGRGWRPEREAGARGWSWRPELEA